MRPAEGIRISREELGRVRRINVVASGASRHAGMAGQLMVHDLPHLPTDDRLKKPGSRAGFFSSKTARLHVTLVNFDQYSAAYSFNT